MKRAWIVTVLVLGCVGGTGAEVVLSIHDEPLVGEAIVERGSPPPVGGLVEAPLKSNAPNDGMWFVPFFEADMMAPGDSTYLSMRNEASSASSVIVQYYDIRFVLQRTEAFDLAPREIRPVALRNVTGLAVDPDGYARGMVRISPLRPLVVDTFDLGTRNDFAVGGMAYITDDFCSVWHARFLRFGGAGGTELVFLVNSPQGGDPGDPVTISGDVYSENGDFINSFTVRTDEWSFAISVHDFVLGGFEFGAVELVIHSLASPAGVVEVRHQALGEYSVGHPAVCAD